MRHRNTPTWKFVITSGRDIFKKRNPHRDLEKLLGIAPGRLREVVDSDLPEHVIAAIEERLSLAAGESYAAKREAAIEAEDVMICVRDRIAKRQHARMRRRLDDDPAENAVFRELIMQHTPFHDDAEREDYQRFVEKEYA